VCAYAGPGTAEVQCRAARRVVQVFLAVTDPRGAHAINTRAAGSGPYAGSAAFGFTGMLLALCGSVAIIPEPARPECVDRPER
jgi:hypothetical protein